MVNDDALHFCVSQQAVVRQDAFNFHFEMTWFRDLIRRKYRS